MSRKTAPRPVNTVRDVLRYLSFTFLMPYSELRLLVTDPDGSHPYVVAISRFFKKSFTPGCGLEGMVGLVGLFVNAKLVRLVHRSASIR